MSIRVSITDDHPMVAKGLKEALGEHPDIEVCAVYHTGADLLDGLTKTLPDILLLDLQLPDKTGNELARIIAKQYPSVKILVFTSIDTLFHIKDMMQHGCAGYLTKYTDQQTIITAIEQIYAGETFIEDRLKDTLLQNTVKVNTQSSKLPPLTRREKEILQLIAAEYTGQEIADKLFISPRTVENHRLSLIQKLNVKNVAGLVRTAIQMGLVEG